MPTLDFKIGQDFSGNQYVHNYFEKPMNTKWVLPKASSMDPSTKRQILANDLVRRLCRVDPTLLGTLAVPVINFYDRKLIYSGYDHDERLRVIEAGITSYHGKLDSVKEGEEFYKIGKDTLANRTRRNLLEKMSWYKGRT